MPNGAGIDSFPFPNDNYEIQDGSDNQTAGQEAVAQTRRFGHRFQNLHQCQKSAIGALPTFSLDVSSKDRLTPFVVRRRLKPARPAASITSSAVSVSM